MSQSPDTIGWRSHPCARGTRLRCIGGKKKVLATFVVGWCLFKVDFALAQSTDPPTVPPADSRVDISEFSLDELLSEPVVETAGKRRQDQSRAPSPISVITREQIDMLPALYVGDLLATLPGLDVRWDVMQRLFAGIRGLGGTALNARTLVLVDGQPLNDPLSGDAAVGHFLPLADVERIEVIRGPGSSLYGANAFSGVINIITRHQNPQPESGAQSVQISTLVGNQRTLRLQGLLDQMAGPVGVVASVEALRTDGPFLPVQVSLPSGNTTIDNDDISSIAGSLSARWGELKVTGRYVAGKRGWPGQFPTNRAGQLRSCSECHTASSPTGAGNKYEASGNSCGSCHVHPHDRESMQRGQLSATYARDLSPQLKLNASAFHTEWRNNYDVEQETAFLDTPQMHQLATRQRTTGAEVHLQHSPDGDTNVLLFGGEVRRNETASSLLHRPSGANHIEELQAGLFAEDEFRPTDWLSLVAGSRLDHNSLFGFAFSPRGGIVLTPVEHGAIRLSVASAFRNPNFSELYIDIRKGPVSKHGNPDLRPEHITTADLGASYAVALPVVLKAAVSGFYSEARDLIGFRSIPDPDGSGTLGSLANNERAHVFGGEFELSVERGGKKSRGRVFANYSYQNARNQAEQRLPYAPRDKINLGLSVATGEVQGLLQTRYVGSRKTTTGQRLKPFLTVDATLQWSLRDAFALQLWANNLLDETYQESLGIPGGRRALFLRVAYNH